MADATTKPTAIIWFRDDLRISDNAALASVANDFTVVPVYIRQDHIANRSIGGAKKWWLHRSLEALADDLAKLGAPLVLASGDPYVILANLAQLTSASRIVWNRRYHPEAIRHDTELKSHLSGDGFEVETFPGFLLHEPTKLKTGTGNFYKVFSPFWRSLDSTIELQKPIPAPQSLRPASPYPASEQLSDWKLLPTNPDWSGGIGANWHPGEKAAHAKLADFVETRLENYGEGRDRPDRDDTTRLSPHLAFGEITPAQIFAKLDEGRTSAGNLGLDALRRQVGWREFAWHLLVNQPLLPTSNHKIQFDDFPWSDNTEGLLAWQQGLTGYPIVDAGMRQLRQTGWMHNRVRMITASFLTKHLLIDWREGEAWFWDNLVDADLASNAASWQWVAGTGFDAAPYFRIFNPILQGQKFDPEGTYVRAFVPELASLPSKHIHTPWEAPAAILARASIQLGQDYPHPVIDHAEARQRALSAYASIKDAA